MIKILFVCHGNICRSPMAEFVFKDMVKKLHREHEFQIASAATSMEEIGSDIHRGTKGILKQYNIPFERRGAVKLEPKDYEYYNYVIGMDQWNRKNMVRIFGGDPLGKVYLLLDFGEHPGDIADPWYTGEFQTTYKDIAAGCETFLSWLDCKEHE